MSFLPSWLSFLIVTSTCVLAVVRCASISCQPLSNASLHDWFQRANVNTNKILMMAQSSNMEVTLEFVAHERLYRNTTCPNSLPSTGPVDDRSTCPFYNVIDHDPLRYPASLTEARCRCRGCLGLDDNYICERLAYNIRVLKSSEHCEGGFYQYEEEWYTVAVGCACAKRPVALARSTSVRSPADIEFD